MEMLRKIQKEMLEIKNAVPKMKKAFVDHQQTGQVKERTTELEDMLIKPTRHRSREKESQRTSK